MTQCTGQSPTTNAVVLIIAIDVDDAIGTGWTIFKIGRSIATNVPEGQVTQYSAVSELENVPGSQG